jgi:hypothetical protein
MSLDQLQSELKADDSDTLLNLGDHDQLRIVGAGAEIASSIQIQLDRANLIRTFTDEFDALSLDLEKGSPQGGGWRTNFGYGGVNSYTLVNNGELEVSVDPPVFRDRRDQFEPLAVSDRRWQARDHCQAAEGVFASIRLGAVLFFRVTHHQSILQSAIWIVRNHAPDTPPGFP